MKAYMGRSTAPLILIPGTRCSWMVNFKLRLLYSWERALVPTAQVARLAPEPVWWFWTKEKSLAPTKIRTLKLSSLQPSCYITTMHPPSPPPKDHMSMKNKNQIKNCTHKIKSLAVPAKFSLSQPYACTHANTHILKWKWLFTFRTACNTMCH